MNFIIPGFCVDDLLLLTSFPGLFSIFRGLFGPTFSGCPIRSYPNTANIIILKKDVCLLHMLLMEVNDLSPDWTAQKELSGLVLYKLPLKPT